MTLLVPNEGEERMLDMLVDGDSFVDVRVNLYRTSITVDQSTVYGDFVPATYSGNGAQTPSFGAASIVGNKGKITDSAARTFAHSGGATANTIYGYYVYDSANNVVLWAEVFPSPIIMANLGDQIAITLSLTLNSE